MKLINVLALITLFGCSTPKTKEVQKTPERKPGQFITKTQMEHRASLVKNVHYELDMDFVTKSAVKSDSYSGKVKILFDLKKVDDLRVDFFKGNILKVLVNNQETKDYNYNDYELIISQKSLKLGTNAVTIEFAQKFSTNGAGLYRFVDPADKKVYIYSDFEPYDSNHMFPNFDQPNLKATYKMNVKAPKSWKVITSELERSISKDKTFNERKFPRSTKFSTYIFSLIAGPYAEWKSTYKSKTKIVPLKLYARQSLKKFVKPKFWFDNTKMGMAYFGEYFGIEYPFTKYDQIIVPDFNSGAMENVGAVTFSERYVKKSKKTKKEKERNASVIIHELAHMWFGNLVTMDWWNGLWLNESFATIMANMTLAEASKEYTEAWETFFNRTKSWAYWTDNLVTTHPIEVEVTDTDTAFTNFDGITYGKGASVLKQLRFVLGDDYKNGIQIYFKEHAFKNTELADFFSAMEKSSGKDLQKWQQEWLLTAGLNTVEAKFTCEAGKINSFALLQDAPKTNPTLRSHKTQIAFYNKDKKGMKQTKVLTATYAGTLTNIDGAIGEICPDFVFPNYMDQDYVQVKLDKKSLKTSMESISDFKDDMLRAMIWYTLWGQVENGEWSLNNYVDLALESFPSEKSYQIQNTLASNVYGSASSYYERSDIRNKEQRIEKLEKFAKNELLRSLPGSDTQKRWFDSYIGSIRSAEGIKLIKEVLSEKLFFSGLEVDQDMRWSLIKTLSKLGDKEAATLSKLELKKDNSNRSKNSALSVEVLNPDVSNKKKWFQEIIKPNSERSLSELKVIMRSLFPQSQLALKKEIVSDWNREIFQLIQTKDKNFLSKFMRYLTPTLCDEGSIIQLSGLIKDNPGFPIVVQKGLKISNQENEKCLRIIRSI